MSASHLHRRRFLQLGGAALSLPFLRWEARAQGRPDGPTRLVIMHTPQGVVFPQFVPVGTPDAYMFGPILAPLAPRQDAVTVVTGVDNVMPTFNAVGNAHINANYTVYTGRPFLAQTPEDLTAGGPSVEQVIADAIGGDTPYRRLDFAVGGSQAADGVITPREGSFFWHAPREPVSAFNDPLKAVIRLFGGGDLSPEEARARRARRSSILTGSLAAFDALRGRLTADERVRLDAHAERLVALERRIAEGVGACTRPDLVAPDGFRPGLDDHVSGPLIREVAATALSCGLTRVCTLGYANGHAPTFPWLWDRNGGAPIVGGGFENWHAMVHADYQRGMEIPYRWYIEEYAALLDLLEATPDPEGRPLIETTAVIWLTEYSSGRHWNTAIPTVLGGNIAAPQGRWLDFLAHAPDALTGYTRSGFTMNQLWLSLLHMFGIEAEQFGHHTPDLPAGPLPGLLG